MDFPQYQQQATETAVYPGQGQGTGLAYVALGLAGEAGEVANKVKKILRDKGGVLNVRDAAEIAEEAGDVLWYLAQLCTELGADIGQVAALNLAKLESRAMRGKLQGNGDHR
ncbi:nucleotide pyrophosphohydrolase [Streptomyces phage Intolerant]|nr:nucleotide pyrophosphohydrolase [Streptomyces phage Intolerant]